MKAIRNAVILALGTVVPVASAAAAGDRAPAEAPPPGYAAMHYVDSTGCVFVRTDDKGGATWEPQLTESDGPLCGFEPTFPPAAIASAPGRPAEPAGAAATEAPRQASVAGRPARPGTTIHVTGPRRSGVATVACSGSTVRQIGPSGYSVTCGDGAIRQSLGQTGSRRGGAVGVIPLSPGFDVSPYGDPAWSDGGPRPESGLSYFGGAEEGGLRTGPRQRSLIGRAWEGDYRDRRDDRPWAGRDRRPRGGRGAARAGRRDDPFWELPRVRVRRDAQGRYYLAPTRGWRDGRGPWRRPPSWRDGPRDRRDAGRDRR